MPVLLQVYKLACCCSQYLPFINSLLTYTEQKENWELWPEDSNFSDAFCQMLWNTHWLDNPTGGICPPGSRIWHYYYHFQLIQQTFSSAASTGGLFLLHKNHLDVVLCKQSLTQELTVSVSELQLCSLFPVSFSNFRWPLQPQEVVTPQSVFCKPQKDLSLILQNGVFSSPKMIDQSGPICATGQPGSMHPTDRPAATVPLVFRCARPSFHTMFNRSRFSSGRMNPPLLWEQLKFFPLEALQTMPINPFPGNLRCDSTRRHILSTPEFHN